MEVRLKAQYLELLSISAETAELSWLLNVKAGRVIAWLSPRLTEYGLNVFSILMAIYFN